MAFASGSSTTVTIIHLLQAGDHIVAMVRYFVCLLFVPRKVQKGIPQLTWSRMIVMEAHFDTSPKSPRRWACSLPSRILLLKAIWNVLYCPPQRYLPCARRS